MENSFVYSGLGILYVLWEAYMKRWIAPGVLALFVVIGMLTYGVNFYHQEQLEYAKEPVHW